MVSSTQVYVYLKKSTDKIQFILGEVRKGRDSSAAYYQPQNWGFWATLKTQVEVPEALPLSTSVALAKFDCF